MMSKLKYGCEGLVAVISGGTSGIGAMSEGRSCNTVCEILMPVMCCLNKKGSSCGMQLAMAIREAQKIING